MRYTERLAATRTVHSYPLAVSTVLVPLTDTRLLDADFPDSQCPAIIQSEAADIRRRLTAAGGEHITVRTDDLSRGYRVQVSAPRFELDPQAWAIGTLGEGAVPIWGRVSAAVRTASRRYPAGPLTAA